ncbi:unnamed protein product, partial [Ectocarpus fasciculatus]
MGRCLAKSTPPRFELLALRLQVGKHFQPPLVFGAPLLLRALLLPRSPLGFFLPSSPRGLLLASPLLRGRELLLRDLRLGLQSPAKGFLQYLPRFGLIFRQGKARGLVQVKI